MKTNLKDKVVYQIFVRSFYDANNDGNGDILGIYNKLEYLSDLGIDAIWLTPFYETNFVDAGYDVLDYKSIWSKFGSLNDFAKLTKKAAELNIDIIIDVVLNHVSSQHSWFKKAIESPENKEHNYFIWREKLSPEEQKATSIFGGSAWEWQPDVQKYYFHLFSTDQVDLNWAHPDTQAAFVDIINFWYDLGVRGFRLDAIKHVAKNFENVEQNPYFSWCKGAQEYLEKFNELAFKNKPDAYTFGEASGITVEELIKYGAGKSPLANNFFNFSWWWIGWSNKTGRNGFNPNWDYQDFINAQIPFQHNEEISPSLMSNFLSNHDTSRAISRWGDYPFFWKESAKSLALLLFSMRGIPIIYYGEEIGMTNSYFENRQDFVDIDMKNAFASLVDREKIYSESEMLIYANINSRDSGRGPLRWNLDKNNGFSSQKAWINTSLDDPRMNVESQTLDKNSILNFYKKLIFLYKNDLKDLLVDAKAKLEITKDGICKISREFKGEKLIFYLNLTKKELPFAEKIQQKPLLSSYQDLKKPEDFLRPFESILIKE
ncbi:alpha-amylase family glycosyl hydrolase [Mesomycoplasma ovipneumoniae]|uniref:alpha-amylase family glycosyl hydrolase n=1 Tax=Mesomycoplasma ovipneumoniae TaxID=29562 RepID=UPI00083E8C6E|nr:alpha-amylase family glycosyl hydrolase [Mesomycoplasma ovipneumoniae]